MQDFQAKNLKFKLAVGEIVRQEREKNTGKSLNTFANEYEFDRGNLSKIERGIYGIQLLTAWKLCEALEIKFSDFAKTLEEKLGEDFKFFDE